MPTVPWAQVPHLPTAAALGAASGRRYLYLKELAGWVRDLMPPNGPGSSLLQAHGPSPSLDQLWSGPPGIWAEGEWGCLLVA